MAFALHIAPGNPAPIYRQITDQVRKGLASGALREGEQMPSVRALAERLVINPNTVARAYADLVRDGILDSQAGRGFFVAAKRSVFSDTERERRFSIALEQFLSEALVLDFSKAEILERVKRQIGEYQKQPAAKP